MGQAYYNYRRNFTWNNKYNRFISRQVMNMEVITIPLAIIGLINGIQKQFPKVTGIYAWVLAIGLGALSAYIPSDHPAVQGALLALAGSGVYKLSQKIGDN